MDGLESTLLSELDYRVTMRPLLAVSAAPSCHPRYVRCCAGPSAREEASVAADLPPRAPRGGSSGGDGAGGGLAAARAKPMFTSSFGNLAALGGSKAGIGAATPAGLGLVGALRCWGPVPGATSRPVHLSLDRTSFRISVLGFIAVAQPLDDNQRHWNACCAPACLQTGRARSGRGAGWQGWRQGRQGWGACRSSSRWRCPPPGKQMALLLGSDRCNQSP